MKKILIVIHDMRIGGAQKSLLTFLQLLAKTDTDTAVDLMVIDPSGSFMSQIPKSIHRVLPPRELRWLGSAFSKELLFNHFSLKCLWQEGRWLLKKKFKQFSSQLNLQQKLWDSWQNSVPKLQTHYDSAIAYMDGVPGYYVMDKVSADKKFLWVHSEYQKQGYHPDFDRKYYENAQGIITVSDHCRACMETAFPEYRSKLYVLENISSRQAVLEKSQAFIPEEYGSGSQLRLLTVARLNPQKGVDLAVEAAKHLKEAGVQFLWLVAGDGPEREQLQNQIEALGVSDVFRLLGSRDNPYPYMKHCHILVQPSRVEGKSIVLDEAMMLCKPIIATRYTTVGASLTHGENGWIVDIDAKALAEGIQKVWEDPVLQAHMIANLENTDWNEQKMLKSYVNLMF